MCNIFLKIVKFFFLIRYNVMSSITSVLSVKLIDKKIQTDHPDYFSNQFKILKYKIVDNSNQMPYHFR
jgi:hypothetical protein